MDIKNPYPEEEKPKKNKDTEPKQKEEKEVTNIYDDMTADYDEDEEDDEPSLDDSKDEFDEEEIPFYKKPAGMAVIGVGILIIIVAIYFIFIKKDPPPTAPVEEAAEAIDPMLSLKDDLYKKGIGKDAIDEKNIYEQGNIESSDFRKDFVNTDSPEHYVLPIKIAAVNDSVSYVKHRTMTDDGIDMYWVDAEYKSKKTRFTIPYYIWQTLAPQGVMDVVTEVVTDAEGKTFVTSITPVPPTKRE